MDAANNQYDSKEAEPRLQKSWEDGKLFKFDAVSDKPIYSIDTPPPTVSGKMHMGHAASYAQQDAVVRFKRMRGYSIFYPFGTDDNGLPTERLVEKLKNIRARDMDRQEFIKLVLETLERELRPRYMEDWKRIGMSCDWDLFYTTIDKHCQAISQRSFIDLYNAGIEYRKEAPTIWCPECQTAIAQVELEDRELQSTFNDIIFKIGKKEYIVSTTRPELLPSCVAVFYNPSDKRYKKLKGKNAVVPLFNFEVPVLEDEKADPEKGTGLVMCCTFGDQTDIEWWNQHKLPLRVSVTKDGKMNELAGIYAGMPLKDARKAIIEGLKKAKLLKAQRSIRHSVNVHERCKTEIEFLVTSQWFIRYPEKSELLAAGNDLNWYPDFMKHRYDNWIKGLKWDWCISRQRYFGVPFPVWYCRKCGSVVLADKNQLPVDPLKDRPQQLCECGSNEFEPEKDVLDTWATSSLTPLIAIELLKSRKDYDKLFKKLFPMSLRPQAHDIITFWLFNTVVKSQLHFKKTPWKDVMISGWILDPYGEKMSKSKGNIIEPQEMIKKHSADALRFWACSAKLGEDMIFAEKEMVAGQKTVTKLWNAAKFVFMNLDKIKKPEKLEQFDLWLLSKLNKLAKDCTDSFDEYDFSKTKAEVEKFFWHTFCDNYLEIVKDRLYNQKRGKDERESAQYTLYTAFSMLLKMFAPIMPFITEEIWRIYFSKREKIKSVHISSWPEYDEKMTDGKTEKLCDDAIGIIAMARQKKSNAGKSLKTGIALAMPKDELKRLEPLIEDLKAVTNAKEIKEGAFSISLLE
jgi:valyl-tRNA synthetase